jgi:hypothetical protein
MINNDKLNHGKPQLQLWIDFLNEIFLSRWTAHETMKYYNKKKISVSSGYKM